MQQDGPAWWQRAVGVMEYRWRGRALARVEEMALGRWRWVTPERRR